MFLQETHSDRNNEADWEKEWEGQALLSHNTSLSGGVGLLFSWGFTPSSLEVEHVWWDRGKVEIQLLCQQYTLNATQDTRRSIKDLEMEIVELEAIGSSTGDRGCIETLQSKKMALASLLDNQVQGALVRSQIQDITEMDAPSSFFFGLESRRGQNQMIHSLFSSTGQELVEPGQIRRRAVEFFSSLYETEYCSDDGLVNWHKSEALAVGRWTNGLPVLPQGLAWQRDGLKYLEPPSGLLEQLQARVLSFFWDGMHWVQQGVLYLPREEGGQGLIHLASRTATFRIQFIQREPIVNGARLDVSAKAAPRLKAALHRTRTLLLQHVVAAAGPDLTGVEAVGSLLGIRSAQAAEGALQLWRNRRERETAPGRLRPGDGTGLRGPLSRDQARRPSRESRRSSPKTIEDLLLAGSREEDPVPRVCESIKQERTIKQEHLRVG
ncbi:hypothetical protein D4764_14G0004940 [Takifugu flavidus]|uniref:Uncharacterized protein n=1 Tax=Takifugu flavidus TaxID=433684 RepID=A0A5C6P6P7_9TELE|nr:hypothetical protein D4764_14G0004940 [Takifugu flavidus]